MNSLNKLKVLTESSEILGLVLGSVLGQEPLLWLNVVPDRVLLADCIGCAVAIGAREQVLTNQTLNMARIARHLLVPYFVIRPIDPVLCVTTHITEYNFVLVDGWYEIRAVESTRLVRILHAVEDNGVLSCVL